MRFLGGGEWSSGADLRAQNRAWENLMQIDPETKVEKSNGRVG